MPIARQMASTMSIMSATTKEYVQIVTNSQGDGITDVHNVSNYRNTYRYRVFTNEGAELFAEISG